MWDFSWWEPASGLAKRRSTRSSSRFAAPECALWRAEAHRRDDIATRNRLPFSCNAMAYDSLGWQSEVTWQTEFAESQRDGMCEYADRRKKRDGLRSGILPLRPGIEVFFNHG